MQILHLLSFLTNQTGLAYDMLEFWIISTVTDLQLTSNLILLQKWVATGPLIDHLGFHY